MDVMQKFTFQLHKNPLSHIINTIAADGLCGLFYQES